MRALKTILVMLFSVLGLAAVLALLGPGKSLVVRATVLPLPLGQARALLMDSAQWHQWLPGFGALPPVQAVAAGDSLIAEGAFPEPYGRTAHAVATLHAMGDSTAATWTFTAENDLYARIFLMLNEADLPIEATLQRSLGQLRELADAGAAKQAAALRGRTFRGFPIQLADRPAISWAGLQETVKWHDLDEFLPRAFREAKHALHTMDKDSIGMPAAVYYEWDTVARKTRAFAGLPVAADTVRVPGLVTATIPAGQVLVIEFHGPHNRSAQAYAALGDMMHDRGLRPRSSPYEEYMVAPWQETDTAKWVMRIVQPVE